MAGSDDHPKSARRLRAEAELRENLRRRKEQARSRREARTPDANEAGAATPGNAAAADDPADRRDV